MIFSLARTLWLIPVVMLAFIHTAIADNKTTEKKKVLLVGIDGMQYDHISQLPTPAFDRLNVIKAYAGGIKGRFTEQKTSSGPGWSTVLTGVWVNKHGVNANDVGPANRQWPSIFRWIYNHNNDAKLYSFSTWGTINTLYFPNDMPLLTTHSEGGGDDKSLNLALDVLRHDEPDFIFIHLDEPDGAGHTHGWGEEYNQSIKDSDHRLAQLLDEVERREHELNEEWLVLVTTDHGRDVRSGKGHGSQKAHEKTIFIASNQPLNQAYKDYASVPNNDFNGLYNSPAQTYIVPTVLQFLNFNPQTFAHLDGLPLLGRLNTQRIYAHINGSRCGFEWDADNGTPSTLSSREHVAKFDCHGSADPLLIQGDTVYANIYGSSCGLQWNAAQGVPSLLSDNEHLAKFDCDNTADPLSISTNYIYSLINQTQCGLEWNSRKGVPATLERHEHVAKFDCSGSADPLTIQYFP